jgi:hypothetical protein
VARHEPRGERGHTAAACRTARLGRTPPWMGHAAAYITRLGYATGTATRFPSRVTLGPAAVSPGTRAASPSG